MAQLGYTTLTLAEIVPMVGTLLGIIGWLFYKFILSDMRDDLKLIKGHILTCQADMTKDLNEKVDWETYNRHTHPVDGPPSRG